MLHTRKAAIPHYLGDGVLADHLSCITRQCYDFKLCFLEFKDGAAVVDTKSQGLDMCWCGFLMNVSDDSPSANVLLYSRMGGNRALPTPVTPLAMRYRKR
jgi:hypothetical protein